MQVNSPGFWNDQNQAKKISKQLSQVNEEIEHIRTLERLKDELETYLLLLEEDFSEGLLNEAVAELKDQKAFIEKAEIECYLNEKFDHENAILIIHAGAGGTEAQDWAEMLLRMYTRWAEQNRFSCIVIDSLAGEEAGLKSVSVEIGGNFAYGMLKAEIGIHRLVRISPFNAQGKRQTSFASVFVYPEFDDDIEVEIDPKDLKIDTYRSSGDGGIGGVDVLSASRICPRGSWSPARTNAPRSKTAKRRWPSSNPGSISFTRNSARRRRKRRNPARPTSAGATRSAPTSSNLTRW